MSMAWQIGDKVNVRMPSGVIIDSCEIINKFNSGYFKVINSITGCHWVAAPNELICPYFINNLGIELCDLSAPNIKHCDDCPNLKNHEE